MSKPSANSPEWVDPRPHLPPAPECVRCCRLIGKVGGSRLHVDEEWIVPDLVFWEVTRTGLGPIRRFPKPVLEFIRGRVAENLKRELRSWMCQVCAGELCRECGRPLRYPLDFAIVTETGQLWRGPWKGEYYGCINPKCRCFHESRPPRGV